MRLFLGVDGGQSHTEALVADETGRVLGRGLGGPSNHAEQPGGRERLRDAVVSSVSGALEPIGRTVGETVFEAAHFGMTGGADFKEEIIGGLVRANVLGIGDDAPTALRGATGGRPGIVVIAGTGSVVYGVKDGREARAGGLGYVFSDEGSGFWIAAETIRAAILEQDGIAADAGIAPIVLEFFGVERIRELTTRFYNGFVPREAIAALARRVADRAADGDRFCAGLIERGASELALKVAAVATRLEFESDFPVAGVGGVFRGSVFRRAFDREVGRFVPGAAVIEPIFGPAAGALLLSYISAKIALSEQMLSNLKKHNV